MDLISFIALMLTSRNQSFSLFREVPIHKFWLSLHLCPYIWLFQSTRHWNPHDPDIPYFPGSENPSAFLSMLFSVFLLYSEILPLPAGNVLLYRRDFCECRWHFFFHQFPFFRILKIIIFPWFHFPATIDLLSSISQYTCRETSSGNMK